MEDEIKDEDSKNVDCEEWNDQGIEQITYNLRGNRSRDYSSHIDQINKKDNFAFLSRRQKVSEGIKNFGEDAIKALTTEHSQLERINVFQRIDPSRLTKEVTQRALRSVNIIQEKINKKLKGRTCTDGRKQRNDDPVLEVSSRTILIEALIVSLLIDVHEDRDMGIFDVKGSYLNASAPDDKFIVIQFNSRYVELLCEMNKDYGKDVVWECGEKVLCLRAVKAIYRCVESSLLWYSHFMDNIRELGFKVNQYESCVANKEINGSTCTISWYIDDVKVSHCNTRVVDDVITQMRDKYISIKVSRGRIHKFLGMTVEFMGQGNIAISMPRYIKECVIKFLEQISITGCG